MNIDRPQEGALNPEKPVLGLGDPLAKVWNYAHGLTLERNEQNFPTVDKRVIHLMSISRELIDTFLKEPEARRAELLPIIASKTLLRTLNVLQAIVNRDEFIDEMRRKYPESGCSYCGHKPCQCATIRPEDKVGAQSSEQQERWSITDWQRHLNEVYGDGNRERGIQDTVLRINSEIGELAEAVQLMEKYQALYEEHAESDPEKAIEYKKMADGWKREAASEAADIFARVVALSILCEKSDEDPENRNTNLEKGFVNRYGSSCPTCGEYPCHCGEFSGVQERKALKDA